VAEEDQGYLLDAASIRQLREDHEYLMAMAMVPSRRRLITRGGGGGGGAAAFIITETTGEEPDEENVAVFRWVAEGFGGKAATSSQRQVSVECKKATWDETDKTWGYNSEDDATEVTITTMHGVAFTGQMVVAQSVGGSKSVISGCGSHLFSAVPDDSIDIDENGVVVLNYRDETDTLKTAKVLAYNDTNSSLVTTDSLTVEFIDAEQRFVISRKGC
jgi:hypothetical protein